MCPHCTDPDCSMGSLCLQGAFASPSDGFAPRAAGLHRDTKKASQQYVYESEHMYPCAALKLSHPGAHRDNEPAMSIAYGVHRGAQSGAGGGVSSTGSSATAKGWSAHLGRLGQVDFAAALRLAAIDEANAHWIQGRFTREVAMQIIQTVNGHLALGRLSQDAAGQIINEIADAFYRRSGR